MGLCVCVNHAPLSSFFPFCNTPQALFIVQTLRPPPPPFTFPSFCFSDEEASVELLWLRLVWKVRKKERITVPNFCLSFLSVCRKQGISLWIAASAGALWLGYNKKKTALRSDETIEWTLEMKEEEEEEALWGWGAGGGSFAVRRVCLKRWAVIATGGSGMRPLTAATKERGAGREEKKERERSVNQSVTRITTLCHLSSVIH